MGKTYILVEALFDHSGSGGGSLRWQQHWLWTWWWWWSLIKRRSLHPLLHPGGCF